MAPPVGRQVSNAWSRDRWTWLSQEIVTTDQPGTPGDGGGGGTHPGFGYPLENGPRKLWLSTWSRLGKGELSLTQVGGL